MLTEGYIIISQHPGLNNRIIIKKKKQVQSEFTSGFKKKQNVEII